MTLDGRAAIVTGGGRGIGRGLSLALAKAGAGVAVYGYALNALGNQSEDLAWLHAFSPYSWAYSESPLENGWDGLIWLNWAVTAVVLLIGWLVFRRRDVAI